MFRKFLMINQKSLEIIKILNQMKCNANVVENQGTESYETDHKSEKNRESEIVFIPKQKILEWAKRTKSGIVRTFSRLFSAFRKSRK